MALAPDHPLSIELAARTRHRRVRRRVRQGGDQRGGDRAGGEGRPRHRSALPQPLVLDQELPIYVANFVLMDYGTGAIFGCPAHDQRDLEFARNYRLPVVPVVLPPGEDPGALRSASRPTSATAG